MCKIYKKLPDDPFFEEIDPVLKAWMYNSWVQDIQEKMERSKELGLLIGSFTNYDAVRKIIKSENPDHIMTDEEFDELSEKILTAPQTQINSEQVEQNPKQRRRRRHKK